TKNRSRLRELQKKAIPDAVYTDAGKYKKGGEVGFSIGDLVFAKNMGNSGLVGMVVSSGKENEDGEMEYDVYYRGYNGDIIPTPTSDIVDITNGYMDVAEDKSDISMYESIAKKRGIKLNPIYKQTLEDNDDYEYKKGGGVTVGKLKFNSHKNHNPECDILEGVIDSDSFITYGIYVNGENNGEEFMEYYSGENYVVGSKKRSSSKNFTVDKIPAKYKSAWSKLKEKYNSGEYKKGGSLKRSEQAIEQDMRIKAKKAGKRESADGNTYYEYRKNRSDKDLRRKFKTGGDVEKSKSGWTGDKKIEITTMEDINNSSDAEKFLKKDASLWKGNSIVILRANGLSYKFSNENGKLYYNGRVNFEKGGDVTIDVTGLTDEDAVNEVLKEAGFVSTAMLSLITGSNYAWNQYETQIGKVRLKR
ncbi:MAG: hypothetical protein AABY22_09205, partial [Nanoarchaeota archaeon]